MTNQEINEAVARKLGWTVSGQRWQGPNTDCHNTFCGHVHSLLDYCHSIQAAWEIVEHLRSQGIIVEVGVWKERVRCVIHVKGPRINEEADSAPTAICLAFLKFSEYKLPVAE